MAVPKIRFPGFTDAWEQRKFSEVFYSIPNNTLSRSELSTDEGTVKNIHYGDVLINFDAYIDVQNAVLPRIVNDAKATKAAKSTLKDGDVVIADTAEDETVGKCAEIGNLVNDVVVSGLHTIPSRPKFKFGKGYLGFYMNSSAYHDQLRPLIQGIKVSSISKSALAKTELKYPKNMAEQEKIGSFFLMIDNTITLHQRKLEGMKLLKKSLLQKMFPKSGESVPEVRFPGFTDAWEQRKLGDIVERITRKNTNNESDLPLTISAQYGLIDQNEFFDKRIASKDVSGYYLVKNGEFAYNKSTSNDAPWGAVKRLDRYKNGVVSTLYIVFSIRDSNTTDSDFLATYYDTDRWHSGIQAVAAEGARNHGLLNISASDFFNTTLKMPADIEEQRKIGAFFKEIDNTITLHQRKVEALQKLKKSLLQQMFV